MRFRSRRKCCARISRPSGASSIPASLIILNGGGAGTTGAACTFRKNVFGRDHRHGAAGNLGPNVIWDSTNVWKETGKAVPPRLSPRCGMMPTMTTSHQNQDSAPGPKKAVTKVVEVSDKALQEILGVAANGKGPFHGASQVAADLRKHHPEEDVEELIRRAIRTHRSLASTTGFMAGVGGLITFPVMLPADIGSLWIVESRLIMTIARLRGYDTRSHEVQALVAETLLSATGTTATRKAASQAAVKGAEQGLKQVPGKVFIAVNKKVGWRLVTKAGTKGTVNVIRLVPLAGGVAGAAVNATSVSLVARRAKKIFPAVTGPRT